jgi:hypothetical protein
MKSCRQLDRQNCRLRLAPGGPPRAKSSVVPGLARLRGRRVAVASGTVEVPHTGLVGRQRGVVEVVEAHRPKRQDTGQGSGLAGIVPAKLAPDSLRVGVAEAFEYRQSLTPGIKSCMDVVACAECIAEVGQRSGLVEHVACSVVHLVRLAEALSCASMVAKLMVRVAETIPRLPRMITAAQTLGQFKSALAIRQG